MKKIIGLILSIVFVVNSFCTTVFAEDDSRTIVLGEAFVNAYGYLLDELNSQKEEGTKMYYSLMPLSDDVAYLLILEFNGNEYSVKYYDIELSFWPELDYGKDFEGLYADKDGHTTIKAKDKWYTITGMLMGALHDRIQITKLGSSYFYKDDYVKTDSGQKLTPAELKTKTAEMTYYNMPMAELSDKSLLNKCVLTRNQGNTPISMDSSNTKNKLSENTNKNTISKPEAEYIYNETDLVPELPVSELDNVTDADSAAKSVQSALNSVTDKNATALDNISLYAEEAIARAATLNAKGNEIVIDDALIADTAEKANEACSAVNNVIGSYAKRNIRKNIRIVVDNKEPIAIEKKNLTSDIDMVTLVTPYSSVRFKAEDVADVDLSEAGTNKVSVKFDKIDSTTKVNVSFPGITSEGYKAVLNENNEAVGGKYDPVAKELSAKINESGVYSVSENEKNFTDIKNKSAEMQVAIKLLASKGIISGTSEQEFSPDSSISRAEVAAIILRTISKLDPNADSGFVDVQKTDWFYGVAGSSKNAGIITGYEDNTFRGKVVIPKVQIVSVAARVLKEEMAYKDISNAETILSGAYTDSAAIAQWARGDVALATDANMVIRRTDNQFVGIDNMTRGDAAIILKRLFDKLW